MSDHGHTMITPAPGNGVGTTESTGEITGLPVSAINDYESGACANGSTTDYSNGHGHGQDNGHETFTQEKHPSSHQTPRYNGEGARGPHLDRTLTPGGHLADNDLLAIAKSHRKVGSPLPLGSKFLVVIAHTEQGRLRSADTIAFTALLVGGV